MIAIFIISWLLVIAAMIWWNWFLIEKKKVNINHAQQLDYRLALGVTFGFLVYTITGHDWFRTIVYLFYEFFTFTLFFNIGLNKARRLKAGYLGMNDITDKILAWIFERIPAPFFYWVVFVVCLTLGDMFIIGKDGFYTKMGW